MRLLLLFLALCALFTLPFVFWGSDFESALTVQGCIEWLQDRGALGGAAAVALLVADVLLPIPASAVMIALGLLYGPVTGGLIGTLGSFLAGAAAYLVCRWIGPRAAARIVGRQALERGERWVRRSGGPAVALSRWMPILPEVVSCAAGLFAMPGRTFFLALLLGSAPMAFTFAAMGHLGSERPLLAILLSAGIAGALWAVAARILERSAQSPEES